MGFPFYVNPSKIFKNLQTESQTECKWLLQIIKSPYELLADKLAEFLLQHLCTDVPRRGEPWFLLPLLAHLVLVAVSLVQDLQVATVPTLITVARSGIYINAILQELEGGGQVQSVHHEPRTANTTAQGARVEHAQQIQAVAPDALHHGVPLAHPPLLFSGEPSLCCVQRFHSSGL